MRNLLLISLICLSTFQFITAQNQTNKTLKRIYTTNSLGQEKAPVIDGKLDDASWGNVAWGKDFIENDPDENTPPTYQTQFKILYDAKYLYIGIRSFDAEPAKIEKRLSRRDGFEGDRVTVNFDSYNDKRTGFSFTLTAANVKGEEFISNNGNNWDESWNPIWYTATSIDDKGWIAEFKIPLSQLRFGKAKEQVWGLQVIRQFFRNDERSGWQRIPKDAPGWVSEFGELHGLKNIEPQKQLEIQPFTVSQYKSFPKEAGNPFRDGKDFKVTAGLDAKIGITNNLTLDLTVNPDFGQVEADPAAISLDGFEIFFNEQRPFFVENKNIFDFRFGNNQDNIFFSRRIGRSPQGYPDTASGEFVNQPQNSTILGAAKFSGKTKNGWSIGILESMTAKEFAEIDNNGNRREELVEPFTNYFVGRLQKDFNNKNTYIGGIFTSTNRKIEGNLDFLRKAAYTGGLDFKHQWRNRKYYIEANVVVSQVSGSETAIANTQKSLTHLFQRVDASHVKFDPNRTSLTGTGGKFEFGKSSGGNWNYDAGFVWRSPELELNDIGFLRQADDIRQYAFVGYQTLKPFGKFRRIYANFSQFSTYDFDGNYNRIEYSIRGNINFKNNWGTEFGFIHKPRIYSNTILRGGPRFRFSRENINFFFVGSDSRKKFRFQAGYVYSHAKQNNFSFLSVETDFTYQPLNSLKISISPEFSKNPSKTQYVSEVSFNGTPRYINAEIEQQTLSSSIRINYTINPNLTIQYYGQPFIFRARYKNFNYITNPIADNLYDRFELFDDNQISFDGDNYLVDEDRNGSTDYTIGNPDLSFVQFRSNLVVRWEYTPGSEIFFVWSQGNTGLQDPKDHLFRSLHNQVFKEKPENTFLIKMTYRFFKVKTLATVQFLDWDKKHQ